MVDEHAKVVLAARRLDKLAEIENNINQKDHTLIIKTDMTDRASAERLAEKTEEHFGPVDIYINCAGMKGSGAVTDDAVTDWDQMIDVNIRSVLYGIHSVLPDMRQRGSGHIINIASKDSYEIEPSKTIYCATKHAVRAVAVGLEKVLENTGVRVTNISPGIVDTPLSSKTPFDENRKKQTPENIADAVVYAASQPDHVNVNDIIILRFKHRHTKHFKRIDIAVIDEVKQISLSMQQSTCGLLLFIFFY